ncbi:MAG: indolepyruvate ferredoxin oxidoreductase subunit alpha [Peptococcaceae bacterium]|jgi:indolepyruvate ferredoxin oxidoreductase alpha subunit|nr:indolepyruvate ferredoxin oxidoreductase subunit alpha [Peptococcaceae bacterium]
MKKLLTGNEAVVQGAYEAGVTFAAGYPGTPSTEILENIAPLKDVIVAEWAPNEKVALESVIGASYMGARALATMKVVGLNVAADPLFSVCYSGVNGGLVIINADDPGLHSSQDEQDNRYYAKMAKAALLEPSDSQESKDMVLAGFEISEQFDVPVIIRVTTRTCHSKSLVEIGERKERELKPYQKKPMNYNLMPAHSKQLRVIAEERMRKLEEFSNTTSMNYIEWNNKQIGVIASGISFQYAKEVFGTQASYLKLGFTHPLPEQKIKEFAAQVERLYIIEETEPYIEEKVKQLGIPCIGKEKIPNIGELNPSIIAKVLLGEEKPLIQYDASVVAGRPPVLCAGCPHRGFFYELAKVKNVFLSGDIGCYALGGANPFKSFDWSLCMGSSISIAHGAQQTLKQNKSEQRVIAFIGDSTFMHTGVNSLLDIVFNKSNVITCILDNRITGMTGHQENPASGYTLRGEKTRAVNIEELVKAIGIQHVKVINPLQLDQIKEALAWALEINEASVIITRWPCVLKRMTEDDQAEFNIGKAQCRVDEETCIGCKQCIKTGCPALVFDKEQKKVKIDDSQCNGCEVCLQVCPVSAITKVGE